jgi:hypothetical protein
MRADNALEPELGAVLAALGGLPPQFVGRVDGEIALACELWHRASVRGWRLFRWTPRLEYLFVFHRDGYLREAALDRIDGPLATPFWLAAVAYRLNDWAPLVRAAAVRCARHTFPVTSAAIIADVALVLLERRRYWRRWTDEATVLDEAFARHDAAAELAERLKTKNSGPLGRILMHATRWEAMDPHLLDLARDAAQPAVRAVALRALLRGRATWSVRYRRQWLDKSHNIFRWEPVLDGRDLARPLSLLELLGLGAHDKSAIVRKIVADSLIEHRRHLPGLRPLIQKLAIDRNPAVRERIAFLLRGGQSEDGPDQAAP